MLHSSEYRNPGPYQGKKVLVVGSGSSGMEIAHDLATGGAAKVWLAVRTPPNILLRSLPGGCPAIWFRCRCIAPPFGSPTRSAGRLAARTSATSPSSDCRSRPKARSPA